jgi:PAS domain S-box-containing protein
MIHSQATQDLIRQLSDQKFALDQSSIVAITNADGIITYANDKFCEISGYSRKELLGNTHQILNSNYHDPKFFKQLWETISSGHVWRGEVRNKSKNGNFYWVNTTIVPYLDENSKPYQYLAIRHDITALKKAQETIMEQQAKIAAGSKYAALGEMAANLTHEINNPLGVILGRCEMLKELLGTGSVDPKILMNMVDNIEYTARRIEKIVRSMRSFSVASDNDPFEIHRLSHIIHETLEFVSQRYRDHGIDLLVFPQDQNLAIECRDTEISQVLLNLLNNSFDAVSKLEEKWVKVDVKDMNDKVIISITDSGKGIPTHLRSRLFDPFFSTKEKQYGTGLGLSIAKGLIDKQGGTLELDELSNNTRFQITLLKRVPKTGARSYF